MDLLPDPVQAKENLLTSTSAASTSASCLPCLIFLVTTSLYAPSFSISPPCCSTQVPHLIQRSSVLCRLAFAPVLSRPNLHLSGCSSSCSPLSLRITMSSANIIVHRVSFLTPPDEQEGAQGSSLEHTSTLNPPETRNCCSEILTTAFPLLLTSPTSLFHCNCHSSSTHSLSKILLTNQIKTSLPQTPPHPQAYHQNISSSSVTSYLHPHPKGSVGDPNLSHLTHQALGKVVKPPSSDRWGSSTAEASPRRRGKPSPNASFRTSSQPWKPWRQPWPLSKSPTPTQRTR